MDGNAFTFEYAPATIRHGPGIVSELGAELARLGCSRALIVTDATLADVDVVMDPIETGLGDRFVGTCDAVTPAKYLGEAFTAARQVREHDVDALVPVGGGSSLDVAKLVSVLAGHGGPVREVAEGFVENEAVELPPDDTDLLDIVAVPTTLPGADLSQVAGVNLALDPGDRRKDDIPSTGVSDPRLMATATFHDASLFATTPDPILARSAMNGFDKGIEMLYSRLHNPITDGVASRGLRLLQENLPHIMAGDATEEELSRILQGIAAVQYGLSTPRGYRASIIHSFGHSIARNYDVQQGVVHAIAAPHVLSYLFEHVDGRRALLAEALGVDDATDPAEGVVAAVTATRDALELPDRLRSIEETDRSDIPTLATAVLEDPFMEVAPRGLDASQEEIEDVFERMW